MQYQTSGNNRSRTGSSRTNTDLQNLLERTLSTAQGSIDSAATKRSSNGGPEPYRPNAVTSPAATPSGSRNNDALLEILRKVKTAKPPSLQDHLSGETMRTPQNIQVSAQYPSSTPLSWQSSSGGGYQGKAEVSQYVQEHPYAQSSGQYEQPYQPQVQAQTLVQTQLHGQPQGLTHIQQAQAPNQPQNGQYPYVQFVSQQPLQVSPEQHLSGHGTGYSLPQYPQSYGVQTLPYYPQSVLNCTQPQQQQQQHQPQQQQQHEQQQQPIYVQQADVGNGITQQSQGFQYVYRPTTVGPDPASRNDPNQQMVVVVMNQNTSLGAVNPTMLPRLGQSTVASTPVKEASQPIQVAVPPAQAVPQQQVVAPFPQQQLYPQVTPHQAFPPPVEGVAPFSQAKRRKRRKATSCSSKYRGVSWHKRDKRWVARAWVNGKTENLGTFVSEKRAAIAVDERLIKRYGPVADMLLNFKDSRDRVVHPHEEGPDHIDDDDEEEGEGEDERQTSTGLATTSHQDKGETGPNTKKHKTSGGSGKTALERDLFLNTIEVVKIHQSNDKQKWTGKEKRPLEGKPDSKAIKNTANSKQPGAEDGADGGDSFDDDKSSSYKSSGGDSARSQSSDNMPSQHKRIVADDV